MLGQRVARDVEVERLLLELQLLRSRATRARRAARRPGRAAGAVVARRRRRTCRGSSSGRGGGRRPLVGGLVRLGDGGEVRGPPAERVERPGLDQPLDGGLRARCAGRSRSQKSKRSLNGPPCVAGADDLLGGPAAEPLDGGQAEDDLAVLHGEVRLARVDVRRQHVDAELAGVGDVIDHDVALVAVVDLAGQQRGHELGGVVGLQVRGLVADLGVGGRVRLVEAVARRTCTISSKISSAMSRLHAALLRARR